MHSVKFPCGYCKRQLRLDHASFVVRGIPFCNRTHFIEWEKKHPHYEEVIAINPHCEVSDERRHA